MTTFPCISNEVFRMKKWLLPIILLLLFSMTACAQPANQGGASPEEYGIWPAVHNFLNTVLVDFPSRIAEKGYDDPTLILYIRLLFMLILFAILFSVLTALGKRNQMFSKNTSLSLALLVSAISTIFIPAQLLVGVAQAYGIAFYGGMLAVLLIGGGYIIWGKWFEGDSKASYFGKFVSCGVLTAALTFLSGAQAGIYNWHETMSPGQLTQVFSGINDITALGSAIFFFMSIYYLWLVGSAGGGFWDKSPADASRKKNFLGELIDKKMDDFTRGWTDKGKVENTWSTVQSHNTNITAMIHKIGRSTVGAETVGDTLAKLAEVLHKFEITIPGYVKEIPERHVEYKKIGDMITKLTQTINEIMSKRPSGPALGPDYLDAEIDLKRGILTGKNTNLVALEMVVDKVRGDLTTEVNALLAPATSP